MKGMNWKRIGETHYKGNGLDVLKEYDRQHRAAFHAEPPKPTPDINDPDTWPEVKPEDVRIGDALYDDDNALWGYVEAFDPTSCVVVRKPNNHLDMDMPLHDYTIRRQPLEVGQAVRWGNVVGAIREIRGQFASVAAYICAKSRNDVWSIETASLTPLEIAPSLDPRRKDK